MSNTLTSLRTLREGRIAKRFRWLVFAGCTLLTVLQAPPAAWPMAFLVNLLVYEVIVASALIWLAKFAGWGIARLRQQSTHHPQVSP